MDIEALLMDKIKRFEDVKKRLADISSKIGGLTEQQRVIYNEGLEYKGAIDAILALKQQAAEDAAKAPVSKTAGLILPEGVQPVAPPAPVEAKQPEAAPVVEVAPQPEAAKSPIPLEVH